MSWTNKIIIYPLDALYNDYRTCPIEIDSLITYSTNTTKQLLPSKPTEDFTKRKSKEVEPVTSKVVKKKTKVTNDQSSTMIQLDKDEVESTQKFSEDLSGDNLDLAIAQTSVEAARIKNEENLCVMCKVMPKTYTIKLCGHKALCNGCVKNLDLGYCPVCNLELLNLMRREWKYKAPFY